MSDLADLIERLLDATGPDHRALLMEAFDACHPDGSEGRAERRARMDQLLSVGAWHDAALVVGPAGAAWAMTADHGACDAWAHHVFERPAYVKLDGLHPAMTLAAAFVAMYAEAARTAETDR